MIGTNDESNIVIYYVQIGDAMVSSVEKLVYMNNGSQNRNASLSSINRVGKVQGKNNVDNNGESELFHAGDSRDFFSMMNSCLQEEEEEVQKLISKAENGPFARPYHDYFDDAVDGVIKYNNVEIHCDPKNNALCIGDMGPDEEIFSVSLTHGKTLKVNRKNMDDIGLVMDMFSAEDQKLIVHGMLVDKMIQHSQYEMEEEQLKSFLTND